MIFPLFPYLLLLSLFSSCLESHAGETTDIVSAISRGQKSHSNPPDPLGLKIDIPILNGQP